MNKLDELIQKHQEMKREYKKQAQEMFKELAKEFWDKNPGLTAVKWTQYTPYFNDGDTCEFSVNDPTFTNAPLDKLNEVSSWGDYEGEDEDVFATWDVSYLIKSNASYQEKDRAAVLKIIDKLDPESCKEFSSAVSQLEDVMLEMFGDHVEVTMTRDGFDVEEYHHD